MSLGDLCHTKASLRLPLKPFPAALDPANSINAIEENADGNPVLTTEISSGTPSINQVVFPTESMDSLCTSSVNSGDRPINYASLVDDFHKSEINEIKDRHPASKLDTMHTLIDDDDDDSEQGQQQIITNIVDSKTTTKNSSKKIGELRSGSGGTRQSDSTDEDSGIESIMRNNKKEIA